MGPLFLDIKGFTKSNGSFRPKELCIIDSDRSTTPLYFLFQSRCEWDMLKEEDRTHYMLQNMHQLAWDEGTSRFCRTCINFHIRQSFPSYKKRIVYMLSDNSPYVDFIKTHFPALNLLLYPSSFEQLSTPACFMRCPYREHGEHCAYLICMRMYHDFTSIKV